MAREEIIGQCKCGRVVKAVIEDGEIKGLKTHHESPQPLKGIEWL